MRARGALQYDIEMTTSENVRLIFLLMTRAVLFLTTPEFLWRIFESAIASAHGAAASLSRKVKSDDYVKNRGCKKDVRDEEIWACLHVLQRVRLAWVPELLDDGPPKTFLNALLEGDLETPQDETIFKFGVIATAFGTVWNQSISRFCGAGATAPRNVGGGGGDDGKAISSEKSAARTDVAKAGDDFGFFFAEQQIWRLKVRGEVREQSPFRPLNMRGRLPFVLPLSFCLILHLGFPRA